MAGYTSFLDALGTNGEGGAPSGPNDPYNSPQLAQRLADGIRQFLSTPGAVMQPNPYPAGSEEAAFYDQHRQAAMAQWAPGMAASMIGGGTPFAEAGALGAAGGRLRNQFTGQFRREGESPLPGNAYRSVNTQAKPVAANSAEVISRMQAPAPVDPALLRQSLDRMDNSFMPPAEQPTTQLAGPQQRISPWDVDYYKQLMPIDVFGR